MKPFFFIFALPRSGTAWLSTFLSGAHSYCYHEPTADFTPAQWMKQAAARPEAVVGAVDTGAYRYLDRLRDAIPQMRFFELVRKPQDVNRSLERIGFNGFVAGVEYSKLRAAGRKVSAGHIFYQNLRDLGYLEHLWAEIIGTPFDRERTQQLLEMNVERDVGRFMAKRPDLLSHLRSMRA